MTKKEQALEMMKSLVLALKNQGEEMQENPELVQRWQEKSNELGEIVKTFSIEEKEWFEAEYEKWIWEKLGKDIAEIILLFG